MYKHGLLKHETTIAIRTIMSKVIFAKYLTISTQIMIGFKLPFIFFDQISHFLTKCACVPAHDSRKTESERENVVRFVIVNGGTGGEKAPRKRACVEKVKVCQRQDSNLRLG